MTDDRIDVTAERVALMVSKQFPEFAGLPIERVIPGGWDNRTFRLGDRYLVRLPSAQRYVAQVEKEHRWLPFLAEHLDVPIPTPVAVGEPSEFYPYSWSILNWIDGADASSVDAQRSVEFAVELAEFLLAFHSIDPSGGPTPGTHNFFRGGDLDVYSEEVERALHRLDDHVDVSAAQNVWSAALSSTWESNPVWVHGDLSPGNVLLTGSRVSGVIDFGGLGVGDPACDLTMTWTYFEGEANERFRTTIGLDDRTWCRARGWVLWKALITFDGSERHRRVIARLFSEHQSLGD